MLDVLMRGSRHSYSKALRTSVDESSEQKTHFPDKRLPELPCEFVDWYPGWVDGGHSCNRLQTEFHDDVDRTR